MKNTSEVGSNAKILFCAEHKKKLAQNNLWLLGETHCSKPSPKCALREETNLRDTFKDLLSHKAARPGLPGRVGTLAFLLPAVFLWFHPLRTSGCVK